MSVRRRSTARLGGLRWAGAVFAVLWWALYLASRSYVALAFASAWTVVTVFWLVRFRAVTVAKEIEGEDAVPPP
jgi:hypothetical protein